MKYILIVALALVVGIGGGSVITSVIYSGELKTVQKQNAELQQESTELKQQVDSMSELDGARFERAKKLLTELNDVLKPVDERAVTPAGSHQAKQQEFLQLIAHEF